MPLIRVAFSPFINGFSQLSTEEFLVRKIEKTSSIILRKLLIKICKII